MQHFTNRIEVCIINLTLNLLLPHVVLTSMTTRSSKSMDSFIVKLFHTNTPVCDIEIISTQRFKLATVVDLMQQLCFIIGSVICTSSPVVASKWYGKSLDLYTEYYPLECVKTCSSVFI